MARKISELFMNSFLSNELLRFVVAFEGAFSENFQILRNFEWF
jgi:hypothetical protein